MPRALWFIIEIFCLFWAHGVDAIAYFFCLFVWTVVVFHLVSRVQLFVTLWIAAHQAYPSFIISWSLLKLMSTDLVMPSNHLILCHPLLLPSIFPSIRGFSSKSALLIRWPKYWSFSISLPKNIQCWFPLRLTGLISLLFKGLSRVFSSTTIRKHQFFGTQPSLGSVKWGWQKAWSPSSSHQKGTFLGEMCAGAGGINSFSGTTRAIECSFQPGNLVDPVFEMTSLEAAGDIFSLISGIHVVIHYFHFCLEADTIQDLKHKHA